MQKKSHTFNKLQCKNGHDIFIKKVAHLGKLLA